MTGEEAVDLLDSMERCVGYRFRDEALVLEALTHRSHHNENPGTVGHNERLEFLGDAVLDLVVAQALMELLPFAPEGRLTQLRAAIVNEGSLAQLAGSLQIGPLIRLGKGEEKNNGREKASILSDVVEAVLGAIYLDGGFDAARDVLGSWLAEVLGEVTSGDESSFSDSKTVLQERLQAAGHGVPRYSVVGSSGPDHEKVFEVEIRCDGETLARGRGRSKKEAEKIAAREALSSAPEENDR